MLNMDDVGTSSVRLSRTPTLWLDMEANLQLFLTFKLYLS